MDKFKKLLKKTDSSRRKVTRNVMNSVGFFGRKQNADAIKKENIKRILICRPNHRLGNQLLITPLIQEVSHVFPDAKIDLFLKGGLGEVIFKNHSSVDKLIMLPKKHFKQLFKYIYGWYFIKTRKYDLIINANLG